MSHHSWTPTTVSARMPSRLLGLRRPLVARAKRRRRARRRHRDGESRATATRRDNARAHAHAVHLTKDDGGVSRRWRKSERLGGGEEAEPRRPCRRFVHIRSSPAVINAVILANNNITTLPIITTSLSTAAAHVPTTSSTYFACPRRVSVRTALDGASCVRDNNITILYCSSCDSRTRVAGGG